MAKRSVKKTKKYQNKIEKVMHEFAQGLLRSGLHGKKKVTSRKQALAIALSEARNAVRPKKTVKNKKRKK